MLSELCKELRNWFDRYQPHFHGTTTISGGRITDRDFLDAIKPNQYFRIEGSIFNDGVYKNDDKLELTDEIFVGSVSLMAIPNEVLTLAKDIDDWCKKYGSVDSEAMSPFVSESFGGYSYSKGSSAGTGSGNGADWKSVFASRLNNWRKI